MEPVPQDVRLAMRAFWLIRMRWIAVVGVAAAIFMTPRILGVPLQSKPLYFTTLLLGVYNLIALGLLKHFTRGDQLTPRPLVHKIVNFQISADLVFLTTLLHFTGGIENPFILYFVYHMIIAAILLSPAEAYLQATLAAGLIFLMTTLEFKGIIPHYQLQNFIPFDAYDKGLYVFSKAGILSSTFYLVVYMASSIAIRARMQEEGYRLANIQLKEKDRVKDEYVARVTHDIKGHLAAIQSCLDVVETGLAGTLNDKQQDFVTKANKRTKTLTAFVLSLLKLIRMRLAGRIHMQTFALTDAIEKSINDVTIKAKEKSITIRNDSAQNISQITASKLSIVELITGMLLNAVKYTPEGGSVCISATDTGKFYQIDITDSGIGIPAEEIENVFDEFFRASNARLIEKDGTGLGLTLAKQIIERHGGEISVKSKLNEGSTFSFTLAKNPELIRHKDTIKPV